jgi:4-hydroxy-tetrahydrodipicolinate synthase
MPDKQNMQGVVTAVLTPIDQLGKPDLNRLQRHIRTLEDDGSNAILLAGTTGEGPSFSVLERKTILEAGLLAAGKMRVMAQTGCASLTDTLDLTGHAFSQGLDVVTILPPFFLKGVTDDGLFAYYQRILDEAIPPHGKLMLYHIPQVTQVPITIGLVERLVEVHGERIAGIKDSAGDLRHLQEYCTHFPQLFIFTGNDQLILAALRSGAAGCVTGVVNVFASMAAAIIQAYNQDESEVEALQQKFTAVWKILEGYQPYTTLMKGLLSIRYEDPEWLGVCPPLDPMLPVQVLKMLEELSHIELPKSFEWIQRAQLNRNKYLEMLS